MRLQKNSLSFASRLEKRQAGAYGASRNGAYRKYFFFAHSILIVEWECDPVWSRANGSQGPAAA